VQVLHENEVTSLAPLCFFLGIDTPQALDVGSVNIADTKFEFGTGNGGELIWIDEALTPDSSRFWDADSCQSGCSQPSYDKQFVRDWRESSRWNKEPPAPVLPPDVVIRTSEKYREAYRRLAGQPLSDVP
jgi:phosphoribosylaminoimidazole-succinocarboxamide synthase